MTKPDPLTPTVVKREPFGINLKLTLASGYTIVVPPSHPLASDD